MLPARNRQKAEAAVAEIKTTFRIARGEDADEPEEMEVDEDGKKVKKIKGELTVMDCDLASLASVQKFVDAFSAEFDELHYLILNAGVWASNYAETEDALESTFQVPHALRGDRPHPRQPGFDSLLMCIFWSLLPARVCVCQVNHLSHFLMTNLLLPKLRHGGSLKEPARVVTVSSTGHFSGNFDWDALDAGRVVPPASYGTGFVAYMNSKLLNVVFAAELQRRVDTQPLLKVRVRSFLRQIFWFSFSLFVVVHGPRKKN